MLDSTNNGSSDVPLRKAREVPHAVKLPDRSPDRIWGGPSPGGACAVCGAVVGHGELELEIEFDRDDGDPEPDRYRVHVRCFSAWQLEHSDRPAVT